MDFVQIPNQPVVLGQPVILDPTPYIAPGPLGTVGNLQFSVQDGGTARVSGPGMLSRIGSWCTDLSFLCCVSDEAHYQHDYEKEVFESSRCVGDLLGSLSAHWADEAGQRDIAKQLKKLIKLSPGDLESLRGWRESLRAYMYRLTGSDIQALRAGPLSVPAAREAILNQFKTRALRGQAHLVLEQVEEAFAPRRRQLDLLEALGKIDRMGVFARVDRVGLRTDLITVRTNMDQLRDALRSLPEEQVNNLYITLREITEVLQAQQQQQYLPPESVEDARELEKLVRNLRSSIATIMGYPLDEELIPVDRSLNLEVVEVKVDEPSEV